MSDGVNLGGPARRPALRAEYRPSYRPVRQKPVMPVLRRIGAVAAGCAFIGLLVVGGVELVGRHRGGVPVVEAPLGPVRVKPADPGGMKLNGSDMNVAPDGTQSLGPAAEEPQIQALRAQLKSVKKQLARQAVENAQTAKIAAATATIVATPKPAQAAAVVREPAPVAPTARPPERGVRVQLAAFTDSAAAYSEWQTLVGKWPDLLARRRPEITSVQAAGRTMWRLRTGPFLNQAEANSFCATLRGRGADCSIPAF